MTLRSHTHTHVRYFTDDSPGMPELKEAFRQIESDMLRRGPHMAPEVREAMEKRVDLLRLAWYLMLEEVPE